MVIIINVQGRSVVEAPLKHYIEIHTGTCMFKYNVTNFHYYFRLYDSVYGHTFVALRTLVLLCVGG